MKIAISNCLNSEGNSDKRNAVDCAVLAYYAAITNEISADVALVAVGSSNEDKALCEANGWEYVEASNDNVGAKRNAGMEAAIDAADVVFRIGSDDILSPALINEVIRRAEIGHERYWELRGFYIYDVPSRRLMLNRLKQFALAFRTEFVNKPLYNEDGSVIDSGLDIRLRSMCYPYYMLKACEEFPMVALKSGDEINSFERAVTLEPLLHEEANPAEVFQKFPHFDLYQAPEKPAKKSRTRKKK